MSCIRILREMDLAGTGMSLIVGGLLQKKLQNAGCCECSPHTSLPDSAWKDLISATASRSVCKDMD